MRMRKTKRDRKISIKIYKMDFGTEEQHVREMSYRLMLRKGQLEEPNREKRIKLLWECRKEMARSEEQVN